MIYILGGVFLGIAFMFYMLLSATKTEEERKREDEEQMKYLKEWKEKHKS